jgi:hypothetical protein
MLGTAMVIAAATIYGQSVTGNLTEKGAQGMLLDLRANAATGTPGKKRNLMV